MKDLKELKERIENIEVTYDYESVYCDLYNATTDYENDTQDFIFEDLFQDYVDYGLAEEIARHELDDGGLIRLYYFLGSANLNNSIFKIDGYGNLDDVDKDDLQCLKEDILQVIEDNLEKEMIKVIIKKVGEKPVVTEIENTLKAKQKIVGGLIEIVPFKDNMLIICNEEGKLNNLKPNISLGKYDYIAGDLIIIGDDYENAGFRSLTDSEIEESIKILNRCILKEE